MSQDDKRNRAGPAQGQAPPKARSGKTAQRSTSTPDNRVKGLRAALTPENGDLSPQGSFADFQDALKDKKTFALLLDDEKAVQGLAIDLNRIMLDHKHTQTYADVVSDGHEFLDLLSRTAAASKRMPGATLSVITGVKEMFPPYLLLPRGVDSKAPLPGSDTLLRTAFPEYVVAEATTEEARGETRRGARRAWRNRKPYRRGPRLAASRASLQNIADPQKDAVFDAYERAKQVRNDRAHGDHHVPYPGPPFREICIVPFETRLLAYAALGRRNLREFAAGHARGGQLATLALETPETTYAKRCWEFLREKLGDDLVYKISVDDFLIFIRAVAEYASCKKIEDDLGGAEYVRAVKIQAGFGGVARTVAKWGRDGVALERRHEENIKRAATEPGSPWNGGKDRHENPYSIDATKPSFES